MYTFSSKLKTFAFALMIIGALGIAYGFFTAPKTTADIKEMLHDAEGDHGATATHAATSDHYDKTHKVEAIAELHAQRDTTDVDWVAVHDSLDSDEYVLTENVEDAYIVTKSHSEDGDQDTHGVSEEEHLEHALTQAQNRPWAAVYIAMIFFLLLTVCAFVYYAIQRASSAGWSPVLFRVMEGVSAYILPGSILVLIFLALSAMHNNHMFAWMYTSTDPTAVNYDYAMET